MAKLLPTIDVHAHVETDIDERDLRALRAVIFAVTRTPKEWVAASRRTDRYAVWGLGCHPKLPDAARDFDAGQLNELLDRVPLIGEVGLDSRSKLPMAEQVDVFRACLEVAELRSRMVSIHSVGASADVVRELEARPVAGAILHWWRGNQDETRRAVELGCFFSLNGAEARQPKVVSLVPPERVLTETDFPHTRWQDAAAASPGAVETTEHALSQLWERDLQGVRKQIWSNLANLCSLTRTTGLMPRPIQATFLSLSVTADG